jgi:hypothetical protein
VGHGERGDELHGNIYSYGETSIVLAGGKIKNEGRMKDLRSW